MHKNKCLSFRIYSKANKILSFIVSALFLVVILVTNNAHANFASNETSANGMCPINHKMYYIGANPPVSTQNFPVVAQALNWTAGSTARTFTFSELSGNKVFAITFSGILDKTTVAISVPSNAETPFYDSLSGVTTSAINLVHNSPVSAVSRTNHTMGITVNRPTSKTGYKIQDVDSVTTNSRTPYIEQVDASANNGKLTFNSAFHTRNAAGNIVTGRRGLNCALGQCTIDANWDYTLTDIALNLRHNNILSEVNSPHSVGYSDFYFCLAPPKLIIKKALNGNRVNDSDSKRDQFELTATGGSIAANSFTTTGTGSTITNGTSATLSLAENTSYTITERAMNGAALGDIVDYDATYTCTNATTGSTTVMPTTAMSYNAAAKTRSFTLANVTYGDEITCTITNAPKSYTFSGTVFNDNGGITAAQASATNANITTGPYANNSNYFNGIFNPPQETGITGSTVKLVNCATPSTVYATQAVSATGTYQISVPAATINSNPNNICLLEERNDNDYPIRTNSFSKTVTILANTYNYPNNNFGRVIAENVALVLIKYQYINDCPATLNYTTISETASPSTGFSTAGIQDIEPGKCIAYKITATNRANIQIDNFIMRDILQKKGVNNATVTSVLANPALSTVDYTAAENPAIGVNGEIKTKTLSLAARDKRDFYFNSKYGTTMNAQ